jgi:hypothetical protein
MVGRSTWNGSEVLVAKVNAVFDTVSMYILNSEIMKKLIIQMKDGIVLRYLRNIINIGF